MGLKQNFTTKSGINCPESYLRITALHLNSKMQVTYIELLRYRDKPARDLELETIYPYEISVPETAHNTYFSIEILDQAGNNPFSQAYEYLKSLPEFSDSIDVLD